MGFKGWIVGQDLCVVTAVKKCIKKLFCGHRMKRFLNDLALFVVSS
jgi:hypothetical protein